MSSDKSVQRTQTAPSSQELGERFDLLATGAKEYSLFLVDHGGHVLCWNAGAERMLGYPSHEIIGQHFSRFFSPDDLLTGLPEHELQNALLDGRSDSACWQVRKDGTRFWCRTTVTALQDRSKQSRSFAKVIHDLTESDAMRDQRKRADGLAEANRSKEEFMALLSHELRSPLSPILNALNILRQIRTNDPIIEQAENIIDRQVGVMARLVDDLLDITRITKGKLRLTKEHVELRRVINDAAESVRPLMDAQARILGVASHQTAVGRGRSGSPGAGGGELAEQCGEVHRPRRTHSDDGRPGRRRGGGARAQQWRRYRPGDAPACL